MFSVGRRREDIVLKAKQDGTFRKAPNGRESNLNDKQWVEVRTEPFKEYFGDWELAQRAKEISELKPEHIDTNNLSRKELKEIYNGLGNETNVRTGKRAEFYHGVFGKMYKDGGLFSQIVPKLKTLYKNSILAYSEKDNLSGTKRANGTIHPQRRNVINYENYISKVEIQGKEYYVRMTIMNESDGKSGIHNSIITDVSLYDSSVNVASTPRITGGRLNINGFVDAKLQQFFEKANNSSKIVDENGEPLVVYHGGTFGQTSKEANMYAEEYNPFIWDNSGAGGWFSKDKKYSEGYAPYGAEPISVYLNIRNPFELGDSFRHIIKNGERTPLLHEVAEQKNLQSEEFKTGMDTGSKPGDVAKLLKEIVTAKGNELIISKDNPLSLLQMRRAQK